MQLIILITPKRVN